MNWCAHCGDPAAERDKLSASVRVFVPAAWRTHVPYGGGALLEDLRAGRLTDATDIANALDELTRSITP